MKTTWTYNNNTKKTVSKTQAMHLIRAYGTLGRPRAWPSRRHNENPGRRGGGKSKTRRPGPRGNRGNHCPARTLSSQRRWVKAMRPMLPQPGGFEGLGLGSDTP